MHDHKTRVLFVSIAPPENDCGIRIVMHRHLVERQPFDVLVATNINYAVPTEPHVRLRIPYLLHRLQHSRFGPRFRRWIVDYETLVWPVTSSRALDDAVRHFKPDVVLTLADTALGHLAWRTARRNGLPLATLFLDWFPMMEGYSGHVWTRRWLNRRFRQLYVRSDLAICTSDGMREALGPHPNSRVIYPMPGRHDIAVQGGPPSSGKFRLAYVGCVEHTYGRMLCSLIENFESSPDLEIVVVGPNPDWPNSSLERARKHGVYLGFMPPGKAAAVLAGADALLVVMSFEQQYELFARTSFTTKFLDYAAFGKPIILWGPEWCTPARVARKHGGAVVVDRFLPDELAEQCRRLARDSAFRAQLVDQAAVLHKTLFNPDRLQAAFVDAIEQLVRSRQLRSDPSPQRGAMAHSLETSSH